MRKYSIPKVAYVLLILMIACLSLGYTYAYFSAFATASNNTELGKLNITWRNMGTKNDELTNLFNDTSSILISGDTTLTRGEFSPIQATDNKGDTYALKLQMANFGGTVDAYCRLKIEATYTPLNGTATPCDPGWIQLGLDIYNQKTLITDIDYNIHGMYGWFYDQYTNSYYYGTKTTEGNNDVINLQVLPKNESRLIVDQIYLSNEASSALLGSNISIKLTLEGVQSTNAAYKTVWGVNW